MSVIVDYQYYTDVYKGQDADQTSFPTLNAHASRIIGAMARWQVNEDTIDSFPSLIQNLYRLAVCSQIDFLSINGLESMNSSGSEGFTVGKVTVREGSGAGKGGAMSMSISPAAMLYLEQTGLLNPAVPVVGCCVC